MVLGTRIRGITSDVGMRSPRETRVAREASLCAKSRVLMANILNLVPSIRYVAIIGFSATAERARADRLATHDRCTGIFIIERSTARRS